MVWSLHGNKVREQLRGWLKGERLGSLTLLLSTNWSCAEGRSWVLGTLTSLAGAEVGSGGDRAELGSETQPNPDSLTSDEAEEPRVVDEEPSLG